MSVKTYLIIFAVFMTSLSCLFFSIKEKEEQIKRNQAQVQRMLDEQNKRIHELNEAQAEDIRQKKELLDRLEKLKE